MRIARLLCFALALALSVPGGALALDVHREVLPNGLVLLHAKRDNLPLVVLTLLVKASSRNEPAKKTGTAYLTASLLTEGTKSRSLDDISKEVDFIGASLWASVNDDYLRVNLSVLKKDMEKGFELFSDVLLNPVFPEEELKRKKLLIEGDLKDSEDDPSFVATKAFISEVYGDHPYGRIIRGSEETHKNISREDLIGFHKAYFRPNNAILVVVGDIGLDELHSLIERRFNGWEQGKIPDVDMPPIPKPARRVEKIDKDLKQANIMLGHLGIRRDDPSFYAVSVMNFILGGGGFSSRLMDSIREEKGLAYSVYSTFSARLDPGPFWVGVQTKNASANEVIGQILDEMAMMRKKGVTDEELSDAKAYLTGSFPIKLDTMVSNVGFLSAVEFYGLGLDYIEEYSKRINAVTKEDVLQAARGFLDPKNYVLVVVARQSEADIAY